MTQLPGYLATSFPTSLENLCPSFQGPSHSPAITNSRNLRHCLQLSTGCFGWALSPCCLLVSLLCFLPNPDRTSQLFLVLALPECCWSEAWCVPLGWCRTSVATAGSNQCYLVRWSKELSRYPPGLVVSGDW